MGKCPKLLPRLCGPWTIVKKLSDVAYRVELPLGYCVHPVFHVSKLKKFISKQDNLVHGLVALQESESIADGLDKVLDQRVKQLCNRTIREFLVAWKGLPLTNSIWELEALIHKHFPQLSLRMMIFEGGENVRN